MAPPPVHGTDLNAGLIGAWDFEDNLADDSGLSRGASLVHACPFGAGRIGKGLTPSIQEGKSRYATIALYPELVNLKDRFTLAAWVKWAGPNGAGGGYSVVFARFTPKRVFLLDIADHGAIRIYLNNGAFNQSMPQAISKNEWTHVAVTFDGEKVKLYTNGSLGSSWPFSASLMGEADGDLTLGARQDNPNAYSLNGGALDQVRIYNTALTPKDVGVLTREIPAPGGKGKMPAKSPGVSLPNMGGAPVAREAEAGIPAGGVVFSAEKMSGFQGPDNGKALSRYDRDSGVWYLERLERDSSDWSALLQEVPNRDFKVGEVAHFRFDVRCTSPLPAQNVGQVRFRFQTIGGREFAYERRVKPSEVWEHLELPVLITRDFTGPNGQLMFLFGSGTQKLEVKNFEARIYPKGTDVSALPRTAITYPGREPGAPWRARALARIESNRKFDFALEFRGIDGGTLKGAKISLSQSGKEFKFGTSTAGVDFESEYFKRLPGLFNTVTVENYLKLLPSPFGSQIVEGHLGYLEQNHWPIYGHLLFWPMWHYQNLNKERIEEYKKDPVALRDYILGQARGKLEAYRGRVFGWDVVNEMAWQREMLDVLNAAGIGDADLVADLIKLARGIDPGAKLSINEVGFFENNRIIGLKRRDFYTNLFRELRARGAMPDAFGFQSHIPNLPPSLDEVEENFDFMAKQGLRLQVTEFDIDTDDLQLQADYTRDFYTLAYSHPAMDMVTMWGFWEGRHWTPAGAMYRKDWSEKPNGAAYRNLMESWTTRVPETALRDGGPFRFRGFPGRYRAVLSLPDGRHMERDVTFSSREATAIFAAGDR